MAGDRTEQPTSRRLRDARRKGQIARSKDVGEVAQLLATLLVLGWFGHYYVARLGAMLQAGLERMADGAGQVLDAGLLTRLVVGGTVNVAILTGPLALSAAFAVAGAATLQGGWNVASEALQFKWERLNPATGLKRLFSRAGFELVKTLLTVAIIVWLGWRAVEATLTEAAGYGRLVPLRSAWMGWEQAERLLRQTTIALAILAGGDYLLQRWRLQRSLRMTKQEVRDDMRLIEGNPEVKARVRRLQRDMIRRRMLAEVPKATVVITNPTEYTVAVEYRREGMPAPRVVAKGKNLLAARIRAIAREHDVPIVENVPLAQALYRGIEIGAFIPAELFGAVAEVLAYLIRLRRLAL